MLIGVYGNEILVPRLPVGIPLAFTAGIVLEGEGGFDLSGKLIHVDSREELLSFGATGEAKTSGAAYVPFKFPFVKFTESGTYQILLAVEGEEERLTETFRVKTV